MSVEQRVFWGSEFLRTECVVCGAFSGQCVLLLRVACFWQHVLLTVYVQGSAFFVCIACC